MLLPACSTGSAGPAGQTAGASTTATTTPTASSGASTATTPTTPTAPTTSAAPVRTRTVHVTSVLADDSTVGVGMPIVLRFNPLPTDSSAFVKAAKITINGTPANGAWYWEQPTADDVKAHVMEAHYRTQQYWPPNSTIKVSLPIGGLSAGKGLVYDDKLTSVTFRTGDAHISTVNGSTLRMTVTDNGKQVAPPGEKSLLVSLGAPATPTYLGTKIVMQKGEDDPATGEPRPDGTVRMIGTGSDHYDLLVPWSVRVTESGEYVHAAKWNDHLGQYSSSNGCTNLSTSDAKWFYQFSRVGDVVRYVDNPHSGGTMPVWDGLGDWNVPWPQWRAGGKLPAT